MLILVSLERFIGPLWLATGTNGDVTGARSRKSTIKGTADGYPSRPTMPPISPRLYNETRLRG
ncbi:hypothetical protein V3C99_012768 [Haemonchus contortus]